MKMLGMGRKSETAMQHGKHVLVEKPLATTVAEGRAMVDQARKSNVVLMVGHTFLYNPAIRELRRRVRSGELGEVRYIHCARLNLGPYRSDVDVFWDLAPHDISVMNYLLDAMPVSATAWGDSLAFGSLNDLAYVRLEYENPKIIGAAHVSWLDPRKTRTVTVVGSQQMAVFDDLSPEPLRIFDRGLAAVDAASPDRPITYRYGDIVAPHIRTDEPLAVQDRHFVESVLSGKAPDTDGLNGLSVVAVLAAARESARRKMPIALGDIPDLVRTEELLGSAA